MRTTIEMTDEQRAKLVHLAAKRGVKGFSTLVQEALDAYLETMENRESEIQAALAMQGSLAGGEAEHLAKACQRIREDWR